MDCVCAKGDRSIEEAPDLRLDVPMELTLAVLAWLPPNEIALSARRTCKAAAQHFAKEHHRIAAIDQPLPPHAANGPLEEEAVAAFRALSFRHRLRSLPVAAASGSIANLDVALRLLQPFIFSELLRSTLYLDELRRVEKNIDDTGTAAIKSGNVGAVSWLLERCPGLVGGSRALEAAARHCLLPQLQEAWAALSATDSSLALGREVLEAAAGSATPDAIAKMEWLMQQGGCALMYKTAAAAACSGDLSRLRWMRERGCSFDSWVVLEAALRHADLSVAEWLVGEAGCPFPDPQMADDVASAAAASGSVAKLRWLQARGFLPEVPGGRLLAAAAGSGCVEALRFLHQRGGGPLLDPSVTSMAVCSGNVECVAYLREVGCPMDGDMCRNWYRPGCRGGLSMLRWLLEEALVSARSLSLQDIILHWPSPTAADRRKLLEAVRLVVPPSGGSGLLDAHSPAAGAYIAA